MQVPKMVEKEEGWIINISDAEAFDTGPHHASYAASKYFCLLRRASSLF